MLAAGWYKNLTLISNGHIIKIYFMEIKPVYISFNVVELYFGKRNKQESKKAKRFSSLCTLKV